MFAKIFKKKIIKITKPKATMKQFYFLLLSVFSFAASAQTYTIYNSDNSNLVNATINDIKIDANGVLWMSSFAGVSTFNGTTFTNYTPENSQIQTNAIAKIEIDGLNRKWMTTYQNGLIMFNGTTWTNYKTNNSNIPSNIVTDISIDNANNVWVATDNGLAKFNGTTWTVYNSSNSQINTNDITAVKAESPTNVWYIRNGAVLAKFNGTTFTTYTDGVLDIFKVSGNDVYGKTQYGYAKFVNGDWTSSYDYLQGGSCLLDCQISDFEIDQNNKVWLSFYTECAAGGVQNFSNCTNYTSNGAGTPFSYVTAFKIQSATVKWFFVAETGLVKMTHTNLGVDTVAYNGKNSLVYPNPAKHEFTVKGAENGAFSYSIFDLTGRMVSGGASQYNQAINIDALPSGTYLVKTADANNIQSTHKIVKE